MQGLQGLPATPRPTLFESPSTQPSPAQATLASQTSQPVRCRPTHPSLCRQPQRLASGNSVLALPKYVASYLLAFCAMARGRPTRAHPLCNLHCVHGGVRRPLTLYSRLRHRFTTTTTTTTIRMDKHNNRDKCQSLHPSTPTYHARRHWAGSTVHALSTVYSQIANFRSISQPSQWQWLPITSPIPNPEPTDHPTPRIF